MITVMHLRLSSSLAVVAVTAATLIGGGAGTASAQGFPGLPPVPTVDEVLAHARSLVPAEVLAAAGSAAPAPAGVFRDVSAGLRGGIVREIDGYRVGNGRGTLAPNPGLDNEAQAWANHLAARDIVVHNRGLIDRGFGENIVAAGTHCGASCLVTLWKNSPGHNENLLDPGYRSAGMGIAYSVSGKVFVVHNFAY